MRTPTSGADNPGGMSGHSAHDVVTADDWDDWPDFDSLEANSDIEPDDDEPEAA